MRTLLFLGVLFCANSLAAPLAFTQLAVGQTTPSDDDEDETPAAKPEEQKPGPAAPAPTPAPSAASPAATPAPAPAPAPAAADQDQMRLVNGAPLFNPNVGVHIVEQKRFSDSGRFEVTLYPLAFQVNGKFTQHVGTMGQLTYHLQENFAFIVTGGGNWFNAESGLNGELVEKAQVQAQTASSLLWAWGVLGGVEVTPIYGKFAFFDGTLAQFSFVLNGGAGIGSTRHQLKPESVRPDGTVSYATFGDTGYRFNAGLGAGFRLQLGSRFAFRLELRDVVYTARVDRVNGCNREDLGAMDQAIRMGQTVGSVSSRVSGSCRIDTFEGVDEATGRKRSDDVTLASDLVKTPSSDVLNNVGVYAGVSFLF